MEKKFLHRKLNDKLWADATTGSACIRVGDIIYYGHYPQTDLGIVGGAIPDGVEGLDWITHPAIDSDDVHYYANKHIAWEVLSKIDDNLFLLAQEGLDCKPFHAPGTCVTWETSTVRSWLNGYEAGDAGDSVANPYPGSFINTAFTSDERGFIVSTTVDNPNNPKYDSNGGNNTTDKIFFLELKDIMKTAFGWPDNHRATSTRAISLTDYAKAHRACHHTVDDENINEAAWWLRSPGNIDSNTAFVFGNGYVNARGSMGLNAFSARPALYLSNIESLIFTTVFSAGIVQHHTEVG